MTHEHPSAAYMDYVECATCRCVFYSVGHLYEFDSCVNCGEQWACDPFLDATPAALFDAATHFRRVFEDQHAKLTARMVAQIQAVTGRSFEVPQLLDTGDKFSERWAESSRISLDNDTWQEMVDITAEALGLSKAHASEACAIIGNTCTDIFEVNEQIASVVLTSTFLEAMLSRLLVSIVEYHGRSRFEAEGIVFAIYSFFSKKKPKDPKTFLGLFHNQTGIPLKEAFDRLGRRDFWEDWDHVRLDRNEIVHGKKSHTPTSTRRRTANLLDHGIIIFAKLQNEYAAAIKR